MTERKSDCSDTTCNQGLDFDGEEIIREFLFQPLPIIQHRQSLI